ncbi:MAG: DegQ family serine endoprotease [Candidatus Binatia bacterium]
MRKKTRFYKAIVVVLVSLVVGLGASMGLQVDSESSAQDVTSRLTGAVSGTTVRRQGFPSFVSLAKKVSPTVVNVSTTQVSQQSPQPFASPFSEEDPFNEFWKRFFGGPLPQGPYRQKSLGSGFIIDRQGFILTNNHVVDNAQKIIVKLADGKELDAKVVGKDAKTDIAIIKVNAEGDLPVAILGDSDHLQVGEWVLAIGNPFGLDHSVTSGIVSAKGRQIGQGPYDNFIQTDASINPGNSGGPLLNLKGEVVGINTAIFSRSGGNIGIGFAIPINLVRELLPQLKAKGKVTRGYLGVFFQKVTPEIAESLEMSNAHGALVANVLKDGPAAKAGMKVGDVIIEFDGKEIKDSRDLPNIVARTPVSRKVPVKVLRDKKVVTLSVVIGKLKEEQLAASALEKGKLGLTVQKVTPEIAESLGLDRAVGVVVTAVKPGSTAGEAGLRRGDVILEINRKKVRNLADYRKAIGRIEKGKRILLLVQRRGNTLFLSLKASR